MLEWIIELVGFDSVRPLMLLKKRSNNILDGTLSNFSSSTEVPQLHNYDLNIFKMTEDKSDINLSS